MAIKSNKYDTAQINRRILKLWASNSALKGDARVPLLYPKLKKSAILFVGLNPSFSLKGFKAILGEDFSEKKIEELYSWDKWNNGKIDEILKYERAAKGENGNNKCYSYFTKFKKIAAHAKLEWEHVDLFIDRNTNQNDVRKLIFDKKKTKFYEDQFILSLSLINDLSPRVIVIANALASHIMREKCDDIIKYVEEKGYHKIKINSEYVPIFFSSMLTGARALDNYSYDRLKWHIKYVLNN